MRILLLIMLVLTAANTLLCAGGYFGAQGQQIETKAELRKTQASGSPLSDDDIARHVSRIRQQGRNWSIAGAISAAATAATLVSLIVANRRMPT